MVEPPKSGEIHFHLAIGDGVELSTEARDAIESLLSQLNLDESVDSEVSAFGKTKPCPNNKCTPYTSVPNCWVLVNCAIKPVMG